ncbi:MAG TPA: tetratricopeptide repeat protein [Verrucomicrobiota bacterium]|nr:tetratricopeptide repeat protein [Verrucomicrobiota bacterium]
MKTAGLNRAQETRLTALVGLGLAVVTAAVYWQVRSFDFINHDDPQLLLENPVVAGGLTLRNILWAFSTAYYEYWHPLTWLSHMLDYQLFGARPGWHHLMSVGLHIANSILLFAVLRRMTGALWHSATVAALFALHPTHVESVAWLAERKDVLSGLFFMLTVWAYARYAECRRKNAECRMTPASSLQSPAFYLLSLLLFACGLMSKPMVVTLPFVLLLLDYWPLRRLQLATHHAPSSLLRLVLEKLPFFALTAASCAITYSWAVTTGNTAAAINEPWGLRLANAPVSYVRYIGKTIWPADLTVLYPMPGSWAWWQVGGTVLVLALISWAVLARARSSPYGLVGWLIFLGMLFPTIRLFQSAHQSIADRYTYLPSIGLFLAFVWAAADWSRRRRWSDTIAPGGMVLLLLVCAILCHRQVAHWRNSVTLFSHALTVTSGNYVAHQNLGEALAREGRAAEAESHFSAALRLRPQVPELHCGLAQALLQQGSTRAALEHYHEALRLRPDWPGVLNNLAWLLATHPSAEFRNGPHAVPLAERACQLTGGTNLALLATLAAAYAEAGRFPEAVSAQQKACDLAATRGQAPLEPLQRRLELYRSGQPYHEPPPE